MRFDDADRAENCTGRVRFAEKGARQSGGRLLTSRTELCRKMFYRGGNTRHLDATNSQFVRIFDTISATVQPIRALVNLPARFSLFVRKLKTNVLQFKVYTLSQSTFVSTSTLIKDTISIPSGRFSSYELSERKFFK